MTRETLELVVAGGPQQGARLSLAAGSDVTIGSAIDNDIVLRDPTIPAHALRLQLDEERSKWQVTDAALDCEADESQLALNDAVTFDNGTSVRLGHTSLSVLSINEQPDSSKQLSATGYQSTAEHNAPMRRRRFRPLLLSAPVVILAFAALGAWWHQTRMPISATLPGVTALLAASPFRTLVADISGDVALVDGFVTTQHEKLELATLLKQANQPVQLNVTVGEDLARAVEDVYRTNGIDAEVVATGTGAVEVRTSVADTERLQALESAVRADVPQLSSLKLVNTPPKAAKAQLAPPKEKLPLDPGKRVAMVNSEKPSYVLTEDGSRYFVGALWPGGQRISDINNERVLLDKGGVITELKF